jgi:lipopolysaccharide/colanic/teichoic acid biosynthesis glycosyltransferase
MSPWLFLRRPLDRIVAAVLSLLVAPFVGVLSLVISKRDPGPGVIRLLRVGRRGQLFRIWKLRTMRADLPGGLATGSRISASDDERVTPLGEWLRRWHIDELPQLWNVARGDMLLLGPRPETPSLVEQRDPRWHAVLRVSPGIAGPTQLVVDTWESQALHGDDPEEVYRTQVLPVKLAIDAWYVAHASPWLDALVVVSLVQRFVLGSRPTIISRRVQRELPASMLAGTPLAAAA